MVLLSIWTYGSSAPRDTENFPEATGLFTGVFIVTVALLERSRRVPVSLTRLAALPSVLANASAVSEPPLILKCGPALIVSVLPPSSRLRDPDNVRLVLVMSTSGPPIVRDEPPLTTIKFPEPMFRLPAAMF